MSAAETLMEARRMLEKAPEDPNGSWARSTALLTRQALEEALQKELKEKLQIGAKAAFTTQLILLREEVDAERAASIAFVWSALSSATHIHGYSLPPTVEELTRWIEAVDEFIK